VTTGIEKISALEIRGLVNSFHKVQNAENEKNKTKQNKTKQKQNG